MYSFEEFIEKVKEHFEYLQEDLDGEIKVITNDHDVLIKIYGKDYMPECVPAISMYNYYCKYQDTKDIESTLEFMKETLKRSVNPELIKLICAEKIEDVQDRVIVRLMNYDKQKDRVSSGTYKRIGDMMAMICMVPDMNNKGDVVLIDEQWIQSVGTNFDELYQMALENTAKLFPVRLRGMYNAMFPENDNIEVVECMVNAIYGEPTCKMYVLDNCIEIFGATVVLYKDVLKDVADKLQSDILLLPSSRHEFLVARWESVDFSAEEITNMIREINKSCLREEDVLSEYPYIYKRGSDTFEQLC